MARKQYTFDDLEFYDRFSQRFKSIRTKVLKITQKEMGKVLGCTPDRIGQIENASGKGGYTISIHMFYRFCKRFRVDPSLMLFGKKWEDVKKKKAGR